MEEYRAALSNDSIALTRARFWLGLAAWKLGDYPESHRLGESALHLKQQLGLTAEVARSYNALGLLDWNEGRLFEAIALYDSARVAAEQAGDRAGVARAVGNTALVLEDLGRWDDARLGFVTQRREAHAAGDERGEVNGLNNLGSLEVRVGNPVAAFAPLREALRLYRKIDDPSGAQNAYGQLATAYDAIGETGVALALLDSGLVIARAQGLQQDVASDYEVLADIQLHAGNAHEALRLLTAADSIDKTLGLAIERGSDLRRSATILANLGMGNEARRRAEEAIGVHRSTGSRPEELADHLLLAQLSANGSDASRELHLASVLAGSIGSRAAQRDVALATAHEAAARGDHARVLQALAVESAASGPGDDGETAYLRAGALQATGKLTAARDEARTSVIAVERAREQSGSDLLAATWLASRSDVYARYVGILIATGDTVGAFRVAASLPGRALLEHLGAVATASAPQLSELAHRDALLRSVSAMAGTLDTLRAGASRDALERDLGTARAEYDALAERAGSAPRTVVLGAGSVDLEALQRCLAVGEAVLVLLPGPAVLHEFIVTGSKVRYAASPVGSSALADRSRLARGLLERGDSASRLLPVLGSLYDDVVAPLTRGALQETTQLTIVPAGPLGIVPFAALYHAAGKRFLVQDYTILMLPSVGALPLLRHGGEALTGTRIAIFAPLSDELPGTRREALAIRRAAPDAQLFAAAAASESRVREALATPGIVHVASHSEFNPINPMFSRISLAGAKRNNPADDGNLEVHEILGMTTTASLVFLSGCESGVGPSGTDAMAGVDHASLAQAFLFAGARNVVATLWRIHDDPAAMFAERFYLHAHGRSPVEALAMAQRDMIGRGTDAGWAAYEIVGAGIAAGGAVVGRQGSGAISRDSAPGSAAAANSDLLSVLQGYGRRSGVWITATP